MAAILKPASERWEAAWRGFTPGAWQERVNVREFIQRNYTPYEGDGSFLAGPTERTKALWEKLQPLLHEVPQDAQRRRVRRVYAGDPKGALVGHCDRASGRVRPGPHHRRLPSRGAVRRRFPGRRQATRKTRPRRPAFDGG